LIETSGIDVFRNDFNIEPLKYWKKTDTPDRTGITEMKYIEGLYTMWDELLVRHKNLYIDNCASGGRRIDLETVSRSIPLWRSDCIPSGIISNQVQICGLSYWIPIHTGAVLEYDEYTWRSSATTGMVLITDPRIETFPAEQVKKNIEELKQVRHLYLGDYYPLFEVTTDENMWCGYQFDRPDLGEGMVLLFWRNNKLYPAVNIELKGLDQDSVYELIYKDTGETKTGKGTEIKHIKAEPVTKSGSLLILYKKIMPDID
jgi:alpha-galactosidase